ncbi:MAG: PorV/PorQ family protein [Lentimicrobiaceae bacterium]|nr:PorV/PorQ family protein [Lentimicrobiaceae bacterium]
MKNIYRYLTVSCLTILIGFSSLGTFAGNKDRSGQAGASQLLINPWAMSAGWNNAGMASVKGLDAMFGNIAGTAFTKGTDLNFSHTTWLKGTDISMFSFGLLQKLGDAGVIGLSVTSMSFGDIPITTMDKPDGTGATYSPSLMNINISFAKSFSNSIHGGILVKIISESMADMSINGVALDAGIQYVTGSQEQIHFGITLKNIGPTLRYSGDGLSYKVFFSQNYSDQYTVSARTDPFELPTQLVIGAAYDFNFENDYRLTLAGNFTSNSFTKDQIILGAEFSLKNYLMLRAGYAYEEGVWDNIDTDENTNINKGLNLGATVQAPLSKKMTLSVDYSYRSTAHFDGTHSIGARISF